MLLSKRKHIVNLTWYVIIGILLFIVFFPIWWAFLTSIRTPEQIYKAVRLIPEGLYLKNYIELFTIHGFNYYFPNSVIVTAISTLISIVAAFLGAYALSRIRFPGARILSQVVLFAYLVPKTVLFLPLFTVMRELKLVNTLYSLIASYPTFMLPFATWLLLGYFASIPKELEESALIDGCSRLQLLFRIVLPVALPGIIAATIFSFSMGWKDFLYARVFISAETKKTLPIGTADLIQGDVYLWGHIMAASILTAVPVLIAYGIMQRYVVSGLTAGSVKG